MYKMYLVFEGEYAVVLGRDIQDCRDTVKRRYHEGAKLYTQEGWDGFASEQFKGADPSRIIVADNAYGPKPNGFGPVWFFVPSANRVVFLQEGSGDNLDADDEAEGYVDYLDYTSYVLGWGEVDEDDGGMLMTTELVQKKYDCLADAIPDIMEDMGFEYSTTALILNTALF